MFPSPKNDIFVIIYGMVSFLLLLFEQTFRFNILSPTSHCFSDSCSACDGLLGDERGNKFPHGG